MENQFTDTEFDLIQFVDVIVPVKIPMTYTYRVPERFKHTISIGSRVIVQFGKKKILTAVVCKVHQTPPKVYEAKPILELLDEAPLINNYQFQLISFIAEYYLCTQGEVMNAALPSGFKLTSESMIQLNPSFDYESQKENFSQKEKESIELLLKNPSVSYESLQLTVGVSNINSLVKSLISKNAIILFEEVKEKYAPKFLKKVRLNQKYLDTRELSQLFATLEKKTTQLEVVQKYLQHVPILRIPESNQKGIEKKILIKETESQSSLQTLIKHQIFEEFATMIPRFELEENSTYQQTLSDTQQKGIIQIHELFKEKDVVLLHGITGSGKTEVYIDLIQKAIGGQGQVLFMVPEIALTTQLVTRLQKVFGKKLGVYHSKFSDQERVEVWTGLISGRISIIVGVRSSVFLPFDNLDLIIIDEEHEGSYKQQDPAPRYHGRDVALVLAKLHHAKVMLGSASPSVESYFKAKNNQWGLVQLLERFGGVPLPNIELIDLKYARRNKLLRNEFSTVLLNALTESKTNKKQAIIFQNRRGYAPLLICEDCGYTPQCEHCSVSLTYHMYKNTLVCHYCGYKEDVIKSCPACGSTKIKTQGAGTEKLEEDLKLLLPDSNIQRMDLETTRTKNSYTKIIEGLENGQTDVLVGTQMVSKGFDFENVNLVGIVDFDRMLHFPDFRSVEKTFQTTLQVAGRAGRRNEQGTVLIQSTQTNHWLLECITKHDYQTFYEREILEREKFNYPPFSRMIKITLKNTQEERVKRTADELYQRLVKPFGTKRILGPEAPVISRIRNYYLMDIFIKIEREKLDLIKVKKFLSETINEVMSDKTHQSSLVVVDVDPM